MAGIAIVNSISDGTPATTGSGIGTPARPDIGEMNLIAARGGACLQTGFGTIGTGGDGYREGEGCNRASKCNLESDRPVLDRESVLRHGRTTIAERPAQLQSQCGECRWL